jgi:putative ABC transport system permease protein
VRLQQGMQWQSLRLAGRIAAGGAPLAVMDVASAQTVFGMLGQLSRVDVQLRPGVDRAAFMAQLQAQPDWPADAVLAEPGQAMARMDNVSRAYRVNLTVLALVALFTGGFLVYSVLALSVTRRAQPLALLGVLGLDPRQRWALILLEAGTLGLLGSLLGIALGTGLAVLALRMLGGDLGGGYFSGAMPALQWSGGAALVFGALGVLAALVGAWWPARMAARMAPAQTLKGLGLSAQGSGHASAGLALLAAGVVLAMLPPIGGVPLAAYISVALILLGGIIALPPLVGWLLDMVAPLVARKPLALLAVERARRMRASAAIAVSGVVASLSLAVALTVMVGSFRGSMLQWLDTVLPAALYVRTAGSAGSSEHAYFDPQLIQAIRALPGVDRLRAQRSMPLIFDSTRPPVALLVRPLRETQSADAAALATDLPLLAPALPAPAGFMAVYVSEAMVDLYGARAGAELAQLAPALAAQTRAGTDKPRFFVAGMWRDYARQFGTVVIDSRDFARLSDDARVNDLALWLQNGADSGEVEQAIRDLANAMADSKEKTSDAASLLEFGSAQEIRSRTMDIFDRSFAVTYWLQAVTIGIGLFGVAASFSAQVLARRKEFGLLLHLGLTRAQVLQVLALEGAAWTTLGAIAGMVLGLAVAAVLVYVVNPQSFHWSMDMQLPLARLLALAIAVIAAGTLTAWLAGRAAAGRDAVMAVKEDW